MKNLLLLIGLALCVGITIKAQVTNVAAVIAPTTSTVYSAGVIYLTPAQAPAMEAAYVAPMLAAVGMTNIPTGVPIRLTVSPYNDGAVKVTVTPVANAAALPRPPAPLTNAAGVVVVPAGL